jgi:phosphoribosyl 1,2-cyclic phosphodiesterase
MRLCVYSLFSGSSGNATYVQYGDHRFLIDAGRSCRAISCALSQIGVDLCKVEALFLTHDHRDHTGAIDMLCKKATALPVYLTDACRQASVFADHTLPHLHRICAEEPLAFGNVSITPFALPHDSADCVGYCIATPTHRIGYATDIGYPTQSMMQHLRGCDYVVLESNHDVARLKSGPYPELLKARILSRRGHLSNDDAARCAFDLVQNGTRRILLAHLSEENNTPDLAMRAMQECLAQAQRAVRIKIADPKTPVCLIDHEI